MKNSIKILTLVLAIITLLLVGCSSNATEKQNTNSPKNNGKVIVQHEPDYTPMASYTEKSETWTENWVIDKVNQEQFIVYNKGETLTIPNDMVQDEDKKEIKIGKIIALWFNVNTKELVAIKILK